MSFRYFFGYAAADTALFYASSYFRQSHIYFLSFSFHFSHIRLPLLSTLLQSLEPRPADGLLFLFSAQYFHVRH